MDSINQTLYKHINDQVIINVIKNKVFSENALIYENKKILKLIEKKINKYIQVDILKIVCEYEDYHFLGNINNMISILKMIKYDELIEIYEKHLINNKNGQFYLKLIFIYLVKYDEFDLFMILWKKYHKTLKKYYELCHELILEFFKHQKYLKIIIIDINKRGFNPDNFNDVSWIVEEISWIVNNCIDKMLIENDLKNIVFHMKNILLEEYDDYYII
jgi:hypothetical protein